MEIDFDFSAVLALATVVTGIIWGIDALTAGRKRKANLVTAESIGHVSEESKEKILQPNILVDYARSFFPVILIVLLLRSFLVEPFRIPSGSMMPTLLIGDFILVNKFAYGLRVPVVNKKVVEIGNPERGDVVVFRYPKDPTTDYIKRVVALPGDKIGYYNKMLYVNDNPVSQHLIGDYVGIGSGVTMSGARHISENLTGVEYDILVTNGAPLQNGEMIIPEGQYFVMGDNRDNSNDSRYWGTVPEENLVGRAFAIWMNWDTNADGIAWGRVGTEIR